MIISVPDHARVTLFEELPDGKTTRVIECGRESSVTYRFIALEGAAIELDLELKLLGERASINVQGAYALDQQQLFTMRSRQHHQAAHTASQLRLHGSGTDAAQAHYQGLVRIEQEAHGTRALQYTKQLLLDENAKATAVPSLEVLNNDVQCAHGSAIGQLDVMYLFYMQSRGLSYQQAKKLMLEGFFASVVHELSDADSIIERMTHKLCKEIA